MKKSTFYFIGLSLTLALAMLACNATTIGGPTATPQITATKPFVPQELPAPTKNSVFLPQIRSRESTTSTPGQAGPTQAVSEPRVELTASPDTLRVGETLTLVATPVGIGLPYYYLNARDEGVQNANPMVQVTYDNQTKPGDGTSQVLELVSATGDNGKAEFVLRAKAAGLTTLTVTATGEIQIKQAGTPVFMDGAGSGSIVVTVQP